MVLAFNIFKFIFQQVQEIFVSRKDVAIWSEFNDGLGFIKGVDLALIV